MYIISIYLSVYIYISIISIYKYNISIYIYTHYTYVNHCIIYISIGIEYTHVYVYIYTYTYTCKQSFQPEEKWMTHSVSTRRFVAEVLLCSGSVTLDSEPISGSTFSEESIWKAEAGGDQHLPVGDFNHTHLKGSYGIHDVKHDLWRKVQLHPKQGRYHLGFPRNTNQ